MVIHYEEALYRLGLEVFYGLCHQQQFRGAILNVSYQVSAPLPFTYLLTLFQASFNQPCGLFFHKQTYPGQAGSPRQNVSRLLVQTCSGWMPFLSPNLKASKRWRKHRHVSFILYQCPEFSLLHRVVAISDMITGDNTD